MSDHVLTLGLAICLALAAYIAVDRYSELEPEPEVTTCRFHFRAAPGAECRLVGNEVWCGDGSVGFILPELREEDRP